MAIWAWGLLAVPRHCRATVLTAPSGRPRGAAAPRAAQGRGAPTVLRCRCHGSEVSQPLRWGAAALTATSPLVLGTARAGRVGGGGRRAPGRSETTLNFCCCGHPGPASHLLPDGGHGEEGTVLPGHLRNLGAVLRVFSVPGCQSPPALPTAAFASGESARRRKAD